jgi:hypothetical protein
MKRSMENNTTVVVLGVTAIVLVLTYVIYKQMGSGSSDSSNRFSLQPLWFIGIILYHMTAFSYAVISQKINRKLLMQRLSSRRM